MINRILLRGPVSQVIYFVFLLAGSSCNSSTVAPQTHVVNIQQMKFQPAELVIQKGDTVVWNNLDMVTHDVTDEKGVAWTAEPIPPGGNQKHVVQESLNYFCSFHPVMKGKLMVR